MQNLEDDLKRSVLGISGTVDELLSKNDSQQLNELKNWLLHNFQKIQLYQNEVLLNLENKEFREVTLFIFDIDFHIISFSETHNIFNGSVINKDTNLLDIIREDFKPKLKEAIRNAIENRESINVDLYVSSNINIINPCTFELDMLSSNPDNNRFVGSLKYLSLLDSEIVTYQSLILDNIPGVDVYLFDSNYNFLFAGGKEKGRFGLKNIQFNGHSLFSVLEKKAVRLIYPYILNALQGLENEGEVRYEKELYYFKATPVKNFNGEPVAAILYTENVTKKREMEEQLKKGREEALNADRLKSIFIAKISHEIRTPLNVIMGFSEQLQKTKLDTEQEKFVKFISNASDHLLYLVNEIVFLFKLGMGKVYIEKVPFSTMDLLSELRDIFQLQAFKKNLFFELNISENIPAILIGDSFRLRQILMNLLGNAIKYTDKGTITVNCKVNKEGKKKIALDFEVKDTGVGISEYNLQNIFNVFEQGNKLQASYRGGAGLGLSICKSLVELLGGKISVTSKVDVGSTFAICMPFKKASSEQQPAIKDFKYNLNGNTKLLAGKKILLADDDDHNLILADYIFKSWQTDYLLVDNGQKAIDTLANNNYDIVIIDIHMPVKNGLDVIKYIRSNKNGSNYNTPCIFVTANAIKADIINYLKAGFDGYLIKPLREEEIYNKLCNILRLEPSTEDQQIYEQQAHYTNLTDIFNTLELKSTAKGDQIFFENMINNFLLNANNLIEVLNSEKSLDAWKDIGNKAHKAIPVFKYFRLFKIAALLEQIEENTLRNEDYNLASGIINELLIQIRVAIIEAKSELKV